MKLSFYLGLHKNEIIKAYVEDWESSITISARYNVSYDSITRFLRIWGIEIRKNTEHLECTLNHNYFSQIDCEDKAYYLGFISGDGCVSEKELCIGLSNRSHNEGENVLFLKRMRDTFGGNQDVSISNRHCDIRFTSEQFVKDLFALGVHERKARTIRPVTLDSRLIKHYWRGLIDADGCLEPNYDKLTLYGNEYMLEGFRQWCLGIERRVRGKVIPHGNIFRFGARAKPVRAILHELYEDSNFYLPRKYGQYLQMRNSWR